MHITYNSELEHLQHSNAITSIAEQYHIKEILIRELYEDELKKLQLTAKLKNFLPVLATRHVKEMLYRSGLISPDSNRDPH